MKNWIAQLLVATLSLLVTAYFLPGFHVQSPGSAVFAALVIGLANLLVRPILFFLTLPLNILTLGLFTFVLNAGVLKLCAAVTPGFEIESWFAAILGAILISVVSASFHWVFASQKHSCRD